MSTLRLYFRLVMIWLCLLYALPTARTNPSPFYLNATWTNSLSNSDTIIASAFDDSIGVVYMLDSRFVAHRLTYYTLTAYNSRNWSSIVDSGMFPWLEDRRTKNAVLAVNPYSSELFLATYCYSDCKSTLRVHRFFANLTQIGTPAIYEGKDCRICLNGICRLDSVRPPTFFDRQYQNP
ncbi:hypothetical protein BKA69DRAFT_167784 [Paraphysoderma sedebokerense]|nr:hypothetical protein BKA69DRAFT_167784 [Paraphysoderma sedebokerense]